MKRLWPVAAAAAVIGAAHAQEADEGPPTLLSQIAVGAPIDAFALDRLLREISGLTPAGRNSVFAHNDEYAVIHEIDLARREIVRSFALGDPTARGDFEGIVAAGDFIYLVTGDGRLFEARPAGHRERTGYNIYDTGLGGICDVEGLARAAEDAAFLLLCKTAAEDPAGERLIIYRWSLEERLLPVKRWRDIKLGDIDGAPAAGGFRGSDLYRDPETGGLLILDSQSAHILELTAAGAPVAIRKLPRSRHPQPEGLSLTADGRLVIGDEGGLRHGRMTIYGN